MRLNKGKRLVFKIFFFFFCSKPINFILDNICTRFVAHSKDYSGSIVSGKVTSVLIAVIYFANVEMYESINYLNDENWDAHSDLLFLF